MDIYTKKSRWKLYLLAAGMFIIVFSLLYTNSLVEKIAEEEKKKAELWARALVTVADGGEDANFTFISSILIGNKTIPTILTDHTGEIIDYVNLDSTKIANNPNYLKEQLAIMKATHEPIDVGTAYFKRYVHYKNTRLLSLLGYYPLVQVGLIMIFIAVGYWLFSTARRAEQNQVWVGLAKETAHQLGTPITAIVAWIEHLDYMSEENEDLIDVVAELRKDTNRLELIAERFSKIGSIPKLEPQNVYEALGRNFNYIKPRAPRKVTFDFPDMKETPIMAKLNGPLFDWVLENLLRNALDAMEGKGQISAKVSEDKNYVIIDVSDTGKGIPKSKFKTVFEPGFSTKKRGWGLGLSLTKRIIEIYHIGRIFVKYSEVGKGTTFRIQLPKK